MAAQDNSGSIWPIVVAASCPRTATCRLPVPIKVGQDEARSTHPHPSQPSSRLVSYSNILNRMNTPTPTTAKQQRARKLSERGAASKDYQASEDLGKRKRASKKDKENIDEDARAAEDEAMFQVKRVPAAIKKATKPPQAAPMAKPSAPRPPMAKPSALKPPLAATIAKPSAPKPSPLSTAQTPSAGALSVPRVPQAAPAAAAAKKQHAVAPQTAATGGKAAPPASAGRKQSSAKDAAAVENDAAATAVENDAAATNTSVIAGEFAVPLPAGLAGPGGLKPKVPCAAAKHLAEDRQTLVGHGNFAYRALVATCYPYPTDKTKRSMFKAAWRYALQESKKASDTLPTGAEVRIITARLEQMRGNVKTLVRAGFALSYGFKTPIQRQLKAMKAENKKLYEALLVRDAYVYENPKKREGLYHAPIIMDALIAIWFANRNDEGPAFAELFNPGDKGIKFETIALILAAVQNCVDQWADGEYKEIHFSDRVYRKWYLHHLGRLERYAKHKSLAPICARLRKDMYRAAMLRAGAILPKSATPIGITDDDLDEAAAYYAAGKAPSETESESEVELLDEQDDLPVLQQQPHKKDQLLDDDELADGNNGISQDDDDEFDVNNLDPEAQAELEADPGADEDMDVDLDADALAVAEDEFFDIDDNFERTGTGGEYEDEDEDEDLEGNQSGAEGEDEDSEVDLPDMKRTRHR